MTTSCGKPRSGGSEGGFTQWGPSFVVPNPNQDRQSSRQLRAAAGGDRVRRMPPRLLGRVDDVRGARPHLEAALGVDCEDDAGGGKVATDLSDRGRHAMFEKHCDDGAGRGE